MNISANFFKVFNKYEISKYYNSVYVEANLYLYFLILNKSYITTIDFTNSSILT